MDALVEKSSKKQVISNNYNPSTCEILDIEVKKIEGGYAQVHTKEYWLLCWWDTSKKKYVKRYKDISDHFYILNKLKGRWMIKTIASKADIMELVWAVARITVDVIFLSYFLVFRAYFPFDSHNLY